MCSLKRSNFHEESPAGKDGGIGQSKGSQTSRLLQAGLSQHVQRFVLASEGGLWQVLIPALGSSPSGEGRGSPGSSPATEHPAAALCNPHTKRCSPLMGLPASFSLALPGSQGFSLPHWLGATGNSASHIKQIVCSRAGKCIYPAEFPSCDTAAFPGYESSGTHILPCPASGAEP